MKKVLGFILSASLIFSVVPEADASVGVISVTTVKNSSEITAYIKNSDNKKSNVVEVEFQRDGKKVSKYKVTLKKNQQLKQKFKMSSKGKYRIKYTFKGKYDYTTTYKK